ncbi:hypothetical protein P168DRAFT_287850 [Aspergillus campestris IBT 28561]|uniref:HAUS augmin-like complex subunit 1 n=1 Tax=Aspergillus campestris (strain IBT 28561) TaxID=1392248 RepID=A0A2I1DBW9_ASPC2|nr:uncharacterized protein P168DRAFT_287850 [Aspergillus campestris IBT 28561]PKY07358.1 hypothetical protein P168DRAFT_287850 [Aspergillus campestris IBT 28561]
MDSPLLSPAKARQAAIQAKDWAYVNAWLNRQYAPNSVPSFERNENTLRTLLALAAANDAADDEATLLHQAREQTVESFKTRERQLVKQKEEILDTVELCLDDNAQRNLDDIAETAVNLNALGTETTDLSQSAIELTKEEFATREQLSRVETLRNHLEGELEMLRGQLDNLHSNPAYEAAADLPALTAEWTRSTKLLVAKVNEYQDKYTALERNRPRGPTLQEVVAEEENITRLIDATRRLESQVRMFHDLPKDVRGARAKYKELELELDNLRQERDSMFENLMGG